MDGGKAQIEGGAEPQQGLPEVFPAGGQALGIVIDHLFPVVVPAHGAKAQGNHQHHPHIAVGEIAPQQGGNGNGDEDHHPAHGGGAGLGQVGLGTVGPHRLTNFLSRQPADHPGAGNEGNGQGRQGRQHGTQGDVIKDVEQAHVLTKPLGK